MKRYVILGLLILIITIGLISLQYFVHNVTHREIQTKYILYWANTSDQSNFNLGLGSKVFKNCPVDNCYATNNKSYLPVEKFDAIVFHEIDMTNSFQKPAHRSQKQYYIYFARKPPESSPQYTDFHNFFNWTMTYRMDSDIVYRHGFYKKSKTDYKMPSIEEISNKPHKIAWIPSKCDSPSLREHLYNKINRYVAVDVFGVCGNTTCFKRDSQYIYKFLEENFKFYLSFEDQFCHDYVTEELYKLLQINLIPIVYGAADYNKLTPPKSVIDAGKFQTVAELSNYIETLDKNPHEYLTYFEWKKDYIVEVNNNSPTLCNLCKLLNRPVAHKMYSSMYLWWDLQNKCKYKSALPNIMFT